MMQTRVFLTGLLLLTAAGLSNLLCMTVSFAKERLNGGHEAAGSALELLKAEVLDTVSLDQSVHFIAPNVTDTVASPDTYQVLAMEHNRLKLVALKNKHTLILDALSTNHAEDIATPIALYVRDDEKFPHIVLLLPGRTALEAVGSYDVIRSRGLRTFQLTPSHIHEALKKKLQLPR